MLPGDGRSHGAIFEEGGPAAVFDFYVDSVAGDDGNSGTATDEPFATVAAAQAVIGGGQSVAFKCGSTFREQFTPPAADITVGVYGAGAPPIFDGCNIVAQTWTQADAGARPDVWNISWTQAVAGNSDELLQLWVDGALPSRYASSLADLQTNGGWFASSLTSATPTVSIKSATDPNSSGALYELSYRKNAFNSPTHDGLQVLGPFECRRMHGHDGAVRHVDTGSSRAAIAEKLLLTGCETHHAVSGGILRDVITRVTYPGTVDSIPTTMFRQAAADWDPECTRHFIYGDGTSLAIDGMLTHGGSSGPDSFNIEQCYVENTSRAVKPEAPLLFDVGSYYRTQSEIWNIGPPTLIQYAAVRTPTGSGSLFSDGGPTDGSMKTRVVEDTVYYTDANKQFFGCNLRNGSLTFRRCTFFIDDSVGFKIIGVTDIPIGFTINVEYCVFAFLSTSGRTADVQTGVTFTCDHNIWIGPDNINIFDGSGLRQTLAQWQAASGQDLNSVRLPAANRAAQLAYFQGDPENGDFRLAAGLGTFGDGASLNLAGQQTHWDWNARATAAGAMPAWPTMPANLAEDRVYISDPEGWDFYP